MCNNTLKDHVAPDEYKNYLRCLNKADQSLGYELTLSKTDDTSSNSNPFNGEYSSFYFALGLCVLITYMVRKRRR